MIANSNAQCRNTGSVTLGQMAHLHMGGAMHGHGGITLINGNAVSQQQQSVIQHVPSSAVVVLGMGPENIQSNGAGQMQHNGRYLTNISNGGYGQGQGQSGGEQSSPNSPSPTSNHNSARTTPTPMHSVPSPQSATSQQLCTICGDRATGKHYGAFSKS